MSLILHNALRGAYPSTIRFSVYSFSNFDRSFCPFSILEIERRCEGQHSLCTLPLVNKQHAVDGEGKY